MPSALVRLARFAPMFLLALLLSWAYPGMASAEPTRKDAAKRYVERGLAAQVDGDFDAAVLFFKKAYALIPHPELLFNLGQAYRLKGEPTVALRYYREYLAADSEGRGATEATSWIARLERQQTNRDKDRARKLKPVSDGAAEDEGEGASDRDRVNEEEADESPRTPAAASSARRASKAGAVSTKRSTDQPQSGRSPRRTAAVVLGIAAVVSVGAGYVYYERGQDEFDRYKLLRDAGGTPAAELSELYDFANGFHLRAQVFAFGGLAIAGAATYLWITGGRDSSPSRTARVSNVSLLSHPGGGGLQLSGSF